MCGKVVDLQVTGGENVRVFEEERAKVVQDIVDAKVGGEG